MDELMSMMNQLADGETAQVAQSVQDMMRGSIAPAVTAVALGLVICFFGLKLIRLLAAITGICIGREPPWLWLSASRGQWSWQRRPWGWSYSPVSGRSSEE